MRLPNAVNMDAFRRANNLFHAMSKRGIEDPAHPLLRKVEHL
jgi:hypothetical protein